MPFTSIICLSCSQKQSRAIEAFLEETHNKACSQLGKIWMQSISLKHRPPNVFYVSPDDEDLELVVTLGYDFQRHVITLKGAKFMSEADAALYNPSVLLEMAEVLLFLSPCCDSKQ